MNGVMNLQSLAAEIGPGFAAAAAERDQDDAFVADNYRTLRELKLFSAQVPTELGGGGVRHSQMCEFIRVLGQHCGATALALSMHQHLVAAAVYNHRHSRPGQKLLEKVAADEAILVSTGANDWMASNGTVERVDGGFLVSARKPFASGSPMGDLLVTSAPYQDPVEGWQVLHFPVPMAADGVSLGGDWQALGMRATGSHTVVLDQVFVPEAAVALRRPHGTYHPAWNVILTVAMPLIMSAYLGVAEAAAETALTMAKKRVDEPTTPYLLGELTNLLTTAQLARDDMVRIADDLGFEATTETANAVLVRKAIASRAALATGEKALEATGGAGFYRDKGLERRLRDLHASQFHPLPEKRQQLFCGRLALGLDPVNDASLPAQQVAAA